MVAYVIDSDYITGKAKGKKKSVYRWQGEKRGNPCFGFLKNGKMYLSNPKLL